MLPALDISTGYLPRGIHRVSWGAITGRFGRNTHREWLIGGLERALRALARAGCRQVILDGSFVTDTELPNDYDAAWDVTNVDPSLLDPVLLDSSTKRAAMKAKYGGELFPDIYEAAPGVLFRDFFQRDRDGVPKGVLQIGLEAFHDH